MGVNNRVTPEYVWLTLLEVLSTDNGCDFSSTTGQFQQVKASLQQLIDEGFFMDDPNDLNSDYWCLAAGGDDIWLERFPKIAEKVNQVLEEIFEQPI